MVGTDVAPVLVSANTQNRRSPRRVGRILRFRGSSSGLLCLGRFLGLLFLLLLACEGSGMLVTLVRGRGVARTRDQIRGGRGAIVEVGRREIVVGTVQSSGRHIDDGDSDEGEFQVSSHDVKRFPLWTLIELFIQPAGPGRYPTN